MKHVRATARVQRRRPRAKTTEVEECVATSGFVLLLTINGRPLTGGTNMTVVERVAQSGKNHDSMNGGTYKRQKFSL